MFTLCNAIFAKYDINNIKMFNIVLVWNMPIKEQNVEIQCTKGKNKSNLGECLHLGTSTADAKKRLDMSFKFPNRLFNLFFTCTKSLNKHFIESWIM